jgi:hypothetical protein
MRLPAYHARQKAILFQIAPHIQLLPKKVARQENGHLKALEAQLK